VFPKKRSHFAGKAVIRGDEMVQKIKAAADTRRDSDLQIIAQTDLRAIAGLSEAIDRALLFTEAGADAMFVEAPVSVGELASIPRSIRRRKSPTLSVAARRPIPVAPSSPSCASPSSCMQTPPCKPPCVWRRSFCPPSDKKVTCIVSAIVSHPSMSGNAASRRTAGITSKNAIASAERRRRGTPDAKVKRL
jgi:hypothetical protein